MYCKNLYSKINIPFLKYWQVTSEKSRGISALGPYSRKAALGPSPGSELMLICDTQGCTHAYLCLACGKTCLVDLHPDTILRWCKLGWVTEEKLQKEFTLQSIMCEQEQHNSQLSNKSSTNMTALAKCWSHIIMLVTSMNGLWICIQYPF